MASRRFGSNPYSQPPTLVSGTTCIAVEMSVGLESKSGWGRHGLDWFDEMIRLSSSGVICIRLYIRIDSRPFVRCAKTVSQVKLWRRSRGVRELDDL
jgi:hypothetical protein